MNQDIIAFTRKGVNRYECNDVYHYKETDKCRIVALSDGVSSKRYSTIGANAVQNAVINRICSMDNLSEISEGDLRFDIGCSIRETNYDLSKKYNCSPMEFATTLMMVIIPANADFYWTVHIGDGVIGVVDNLQNIQLISLPQNGITKQYTYSTVSEDLFRRTRVKKWQLRGEIFLMTDGITNEVLENDKIQNSYVDVIKKSKWKKLEEMLLQQKTSDDIGFCKISF